MFLQKERTSPGFSRALDADEEVYDEHLDEFYESYPDPSVSQVVTDHCINKISVSSSPVISMYHHDTEYDVTLDSGGTCSAIDKNTAEEMSCIIRPTMQGAFMADGITRLKVFGESDINLMRNNQSYPIRALVCNFANPTILAGMPFMEENDIGIRPARSEVVFYGTNEVVKYDPQLSLGKPKIRRLQAYTVRSPAKTIILPGEEAVFKVPAYMQAEKTVAIEPRYDNFNQVQRSIWPPPKIHNIEKGNLTLTNLSADPIVIKKNAHVCNIYPPVQESDMPQVSHSIKKVQVQKKTSNYSSAVQVNPDGVLSDEYDVKFKALLNTYDEVFNPELSHS